MSSTRTLRKPRQDFDTSDLPYIILKGLNALRVHDKVHPAIRFRIVAGHRFSHSESPGGLLYLGESLPTCLWECFGDELLDNQKRLSASRWAKSHTSRVHSAASFKLCDLTDEKTRLALGVDLSALMHTDLSIPQAWSLAIQNHPAQVDGLRYLSRLNNEPSLVIFERLGATSKLEETFIGTLAELDEATAFLAQHSICLV
jgi:hypothetical protein